MNKAWARSKVKRDAAKKKRRKTRAPHREAVKQAKALANRRAEQEKRTAKMAAMLKEKEAEHEQNTD